MMRARPGWIAAMSSMLIEFLPLQKLMALTLSSSSLSVMRQSLSEPVVPLPSRRTSPGERPVRVPGPLALEGARRLESQVVAMPGRDDLHAHGQPRSGEADPHRGGRVPREIERDRERPDVGPVDLTPFDLGRVRTRAGS